MMKTKLVAIIFIISIASFSNLMSAKAPRAEKGILDLRSLDSIDLVSLKGEWSFYWEQFLLGDEIIPGKADCYGEVPSYWISYKDEIPGIKRHGFATYHLTVLLPSDSPRLCLEIPVFDASCDLYINDRKVSSQGKVGRDKSSSVPGYSPTNYRFVHRRDTLNITLHVANFHHRSGGFWKEMFLGDPQVINQKTESSKLINYMLMGIMFGAFILFLVFFAIERENYAFLLFSLASLGILLRMLHSGLYPLTDLFQQDWDWIIKFEYLGLYAAVGFGFAYMNKAIPTKRVKLFVTIVLILFSLLSVFVLITKPAMFSYTVFIPLAIGVLVLLYYTVISFKGLLQKKAKETAFFVSILLILLAMVNDVLLAMSQDPFHNNYLTSFAFFTLIVVQSAMLLFDWSKNFKERIVMHNELQSINQNLESIIEERTSELNEINKNLKETIENRSKTYSIIAHDLKSPMASLAQYSDLMMSEFNGTKNEKLVSEFQRLSYGSVHLIDNLLHWGGKQGRKAGYEPSTFPLIKTINELTNLYKYQLNKKEIAIDTRIPSDISVYCDQTLLMITLRNLLNNAVKFTPPKGNIQIIAGELKNKVVVSVKDNGIGMDDDTINDILNKESQTTMGTSGEKGTGLGLLVVNDLVKINKGSLTIESKPGKGTTMSFSLPGKP